MILNLNNNTNKREYLLKISSEDPQAVLLNKQFLTYKTDASSTEIKDVVEHALISGSKKTHEHTTYKLSDEQMKILTDKKSAVKQLVFSDFTAEVSNDLPRSN